MENKACILLGLAVGICALTYYNAYGYILCSALICLSSAILNKMDAKEIAKKALIVASVAFVAAGWWFVRKQYFMMEIYWEQKRKMNMEINMPWNNISHLQENTREQ